MDQGQIVGSAELKYREMEDMVPEKEHWLGGVYLAVLVMELHVGSSR